MIDGIGIPVVANPSSAKAFLLEDQLSVEVMTITIAGLAKIEIGHIAIHLINKVVEKQIESSVSLAFFRRGYILCVNNLWRLEDERSTQCLFLTVGHVQSYLRGEP